MYPHESCGRLVETSVKELRCSVVVATCNRVVLLNRLLSSLGNQDIGPGAFEVIVVDDGSRDGTQLLLQTLTTPFTLRSFRQENSGPGAARNLAIKNAAAELIVTLDDDVVATPDLLRRHVELHEGDAKLAVIGPMALPEKKKLKPWLEWDARTLQKQYSAISRGDWSVSPRQFYTANASFMKADADDAGLFDTTFRRAEDIELAYRMKDRGVQFAFCEDAIVYHEPNRSYKNWLRIPFLYGHYDAIMWRDRGRENIMEQLRREFSQRNAILRMTAKVLIGRQRLQRAFVASAGKISTLSTALRVRRLSYLVQSAVFNLQYWQGMAETLGSRSEFWQGVDGTLVLTESRPLESLG